MISERLENYLDLNRIHYTHSIHPLAFRAQEVARAELMPTHHMTKTVIYHGEQGFGMALVPADSIVDMQELRVILGQHHMRLATEVEISRLFPEYELGAMPPFGNLYGMPVYVDASIARQETIAFNAGTHRDVVHMYYGDFKHLVHPVVGEFAAMASAMGK
jgi:Ala-tRNA(Pro) deacylase